MVKCEKICRIIRILFVLIIGVLALPFAHTIGTLTIIDVYNFEPVSYALYGVGSILILTSCLPCGMECKNCWWCLVPIFFILVLISLYIGAFGVIVIILKNRLGENLSSGDKCMFEFQEIEDSVTQAGEIICTLYCPCIATSQYVISQISDQEYAHVSGGAVDIMHCNPCLAIPNANDSDSQAIIDWIQNNLGFSVTKTTCSIGIKLFNKVFFKKIEKFLPLLKWVEETFHCSGFCKTQKFYLFSNINNGEPNGGCLAELNSWITKNFLIYAILSIILGSILVIFM